MFCPVVDDYYKGMATTVSFHADQLKGINGPEGLRQCLAQHYAGQKLVQVAEAGQGVIHGGGPEDHRAAAQDRKGDPVRGRAAGHGSGDRGGRPDGAVR